MRVVGCFPKYRRFLVAGGVALALAAGGVGGGTWWMRVLVARAAGVPAGTLRLRRVGVSGERGMDAPTGRDDDPVIRLIMSMFKFSGRVFVAFASNDRTQYTCSLYFAAFSKTRNRFLWIGGRLVHIYETDSDGAAKRSWFVETWPGHVLTWPGMVLNAGTNTRPAVANPSWGPPIPPSPEPPPGAAPFYGKRRETP